MESKCLFVLSALVGLVGLVGLVAGQRPSFAGTKPIGFPELTNKSNALDNRFGEELELPIEAKGDRDFVERISKLPVDKQPFWYINWKALEAQRKNPQTYPQKTNSFINQDAESSNNVNSALTSKFGETDSGSNQNNNQYDNQNYGYDNSKHHY